MASLQALRDLRSDGAAGEGEPTRKGRSRRSRSVPAVQLLKPGGGLTVKTKNLTADGSSKSVGTKHHAKLGAITEEGSLSPGGSLSPVRGPPLRPVAGGQLRPVSSSQAKLSRRSSMDSAYHPAARTMGTTEKLIRRGSMDSGINSGIKPAGARAHSLTIPAGKTRRRRSVGAIPLGPVLEDYELVKVPVPVQTGRRRQSVDSALPSLSLVAQARMELDVSPTNNKFDTMDARAKKLTKANRKPGGKHTKLTKKDYHKARALWKMYDIDEDGTIDRAEFIAAIKKLTPSIADHASKMFDSFDTNQDGILSFDEFFAMNYPWASTDQIAACILQNNPKPVAQEPGMADEDIEQMFETLAGLDQVVTFEQLLILCPDFDLETVKAGDLDGDGTLDKAEFFALLRPRVVDDEPFDRKEFDQIMSRPNSAMSRTSSSTK